MRFSSRFCLEKRMDIALNAFDAAVVALKFSRAVTTPQMR
jgi:hypothetical protein